MMTYKMTLDEMESRFGSVWRFETPRYTVAMWAEEEDLDPADSFSDERDVKFARKGGSHWFCAFVGVFKSDDRGDAELVGYDVLGGCSYNSYREFVSGHRQGGPENRNCAATKARGVVICHYFPDMVLEALSEARAHEIRLQHVAA